MGWKFHRIVNTQTWKQEILGIIFTTGSSIYVSSRDTKLFQCQRSFYMAVHERGQKESGDNTLTLSRKAIRFVISTT